MDTGHGGGMAAWLRSDRWRPVEFSQRACRSRSGLPRSYRTPWARNSCRGRAAGVSSSCLFCSAARRSLRSCCLSLSARAVDGVGDAWPDRPEQDDRRGCGRKGIRGWLWALAARKHAAGACNCRDKLPAAASGEWKKGPAPALLSSGGASACACGGLSSVWSRGGTKEQTLHP